MIQSLDAAELDLLVEAMISAKKVFLSGQGRSGLMARALAIRFMHIGLPVHVAGEPSTSSISTGDLLIAVSASANTKTTLEHMRVARDSGATVVLVSAKKADAAIAHLSLTLPARSLVATVQHAGSLFEQAFLLVGDAIAWQVQQRLGADERLLDQRHANLQ